jgi:hypothetical protein
MMSIVHSRIDNAFLSYCDRRDTRANFNDGSGHFMAHGDGETQSSVRVAEAYLRDEDRSAEVLVYVCSAHATVGNLDAYMKRTTFAANHLNYWTSLQFELVFLP